MGPKFRRRDFLRRMAAALPASAVLANFNRLAFAQRKKVKVTDVKVMLVRGLFDWPMVRIETDAGILGEDPLDIDRLYTKPRLRQAGYSGFVCAEFTCQEG